LTDLKTVTNNDFLHLFCKELLQALTCYIWKGIINLTVVHFLIILKDSWPWPRFMRQECQLLTVTSNLKERKE